MSIKIDSRAFDSMLTALGQAKPTTALVITNNKKAETYWGVLESGSTPGNKPWPNVGPRTTKGTGGRIFSKQAPAGWINKYAKTFLGYLTSEYRNAAGSQMPTQAVFDKAVMNAATKARDFLRGTVPVGGPKDKHAGQLKNSLTVTKG